MQIVAVANQKGGCGKTTTAINLAAALAKIGHRVLLVDFDPQGHATLGLGYDPNSFAQSAYHVVSDYVPVSQVVVSTRVSRLGLLPSNILLGGAELTLRNVPGKELILGEQLRSVSRDYEICVIDCSPSLGLLMLNALVASTGVVIPVQAHFFALDGLRRLLDTIRVVRERFYPCLVSPLGVVLTFVEERTALSKRIETGLRGLFGALVFNTVIHKSVALAEAPSHGQTIFEFARDNKGAREYEALVRETVARLGTPDVLDAARS
ncbi:MAG TPA: ParA family protein [Sedimentisphaerales bacterium]|jgi:chromosome partitioning protein|nr:ParA family protein [Sedimentisphaerales bacterium]HNU30354.1 ParA family protein [Sedimentisphaerales bacterium]